jgi:hypothetical protein
MIAPIPVLDAREVCRFCGCTEHNACPMVRTIGGHQWCRWIDGTHTICDAPKCKTEFDSMLEAARTAAIARQCVCRAWKRPGYLVCFACSLALPWEIRATLLERSERGYYAAINAAAAYPDALQFLRERTDRLKEVTK